MKQQIKTFLAVISMAASVFSQPVPPVEWIRNNTSGESYTMKVDASGNVYISGVTYVGGFTDFCTVKFNSAGVQQWLVTYNGTANLDDVPASITVDNQGNVYVTGTANKDFNNPVFTGDYCTIKYNSAGVQQWVKLYSGNAMGRDVPFKVAVDGTGNVYVTGQSYIDNQRSDDIVTIKYAPDGQQLWLVSHDGTGTNPEQDAGRDMVLDAQSNVYVFGHSTRINTWYDLCLIKYNTSGVQQFIAYYTGIDNNSTEYGVALTLDNNGNIYVVGELSDGIAVLKYSPAGTQLWVYRYEITFNRAKDIAVDGPGNVFFCGSNGSRGFLAKLSGSGSLLWNKIITGTGGNEIVNDILIDNMGDIYLTGKVAAGTYFDFVTEKINTGSSTQWRATHNGSGNLNDFGNAIGIDATGNIYVTGGSNVGGFNNMCTIKYAPGSIGINIISNEVPFGFSLSQNYPNPFNPSTVIKFQVPSSSSVKIVVFDALGREVATLVNEQLQAGTYEVDWDATNYPSGVYFYKLIADNFSQNRKMIIIK